MESAKNIFNSTPENLPPKQELVLPTPPSIEFMSPFEVKQEILKIFDIDVTREDFDSDDNIKNPEIKNRIYLSLLEGLQEGNSATLEFIVNDKLLSKKDLQERGIPALKQPALVMLNKSKGLQRALEKKLCIESGILTEKEVGDNLYLISK